MKRKSETELLNTLSKSPTLIWHKPWVHIELGAANYGDDVQGDETHVAKGGLSTKQFNILFKTVDKLIQEKGNKGIFFINDLSEKMVNYTIAQLEKYLIETYPDNVIELKPLVGDFFTINIPLATSIHLKNPEFWFFEALKEIKNQKRLAYFANLSKEGLTLVTYFKSDFYVLVNDLGIGYKVLNDNFDPYVHADGCKLRLHGNVVEFLIKSISTLQKEGDEGFSIESPYKQMRFNTRSNARVL